VSGDTVIGSRVMTSLTFIGRHPFRPRSQIGLLDVRQSCTSTVGAQAVADEGASDRFEGPTGTRAPRGGGLVSRGVDATRSRLP
jgi:hypothetical protein